MKIDANKASTPDEPPTPSPSLFSHLPSFQVPTAQLPLSAPQKTYNQTPPSYETLSSTKLLDNFVSICEALRGVSKDKRATVRISFGTFECVGAGETQKGSEDGTGGGNMSNSSEIQSRDVIFKKFFVDSVTKNVDLTKDDIFKYLSSDESTMRFTLFLSIPLSSHLSEKTIGDGLCCPRVLEMLRKRYEFYQRYGSSSAKSFVPIDYNLFDERQRISFIEKAFDPDLVGYLSETNKTFVNLAKEWINKSGENDEYYYINPNRTAAQLRDVYVSYMTSYPRLPSQINGEPIWADQDYCRQVYPYNKFSRTLFVEDAFGYAKMHDAIRSTQGNSSSAASTSTSDAAASQSLNLSSFSTFTSQLLPSTTALFSSSPSPSSPKKNDPPPLSGPHKQKYLSCFITAVYAILQQTHSNTRS